MQTVVQRRSVLIIDDEPLVREVLQYVLSNEFDVEVLPDGTEALARCLATPFHAVITDVHMPVVDGVAVGRALRARGLRLPLLFFTGSPEDVPASTLVDLDPACLVAKPCDFGALRAALRGLGV